MPSELDRRDFLKLSGVPIIGGVAGCYAHDNGDQALIGGGGGDEVPTTDIQFLALEPGESFSDVEPDSPIAYIIDPSTGDTRYWEE